MELLNLIWMIAKTWRVANARQMTFSDNMAQMV